MQNDKPKTREDIYWDFIDSGDFDRMIEEVNALEERRRTKATGDRPPSEK